MDVQVLRWFQQAARGMTVTEVAARSFISQSGVSRALARLEAEVGTPLLTRQGRVLRVTPAGAAFQRHVDALLSDLDQGLTEVSRIADPDAGVVTLAFQQSLAAWLVPDLVRTFRVGHPRVTFLLHQTADDDNPALHGVPVDLELSTRRVVAPAADAVTVLTEPLVLAVPRRHAVARRRRVELAEVAEEAFIALRPDATLRRLGDELCRRAGFEPFVVFEGDDLATVRGLVGGGLGVAVVPAPRIDAGDGVLGNVQHCRLTDDGASRDVRLAWAADQPLTRPAALFRDHVVQRARRGKLPPALTGG